MLNKLRSTYKRIFGIGPTGILVTVVIWTLFYWIPSALNIPAIRIHPVFRGGILIIFLIDAVYLVAGGLIALIRNQWGNKLITTGPYQFIRHPLYSALIYSGSGALALWKLSWGLLVSAVPIALFWSWHVQKEEGYMLELFGDEYRRYMGRTGQFFPSLKAIKEMDERKSGR